jgi:membrane protein YqaA with SNARE-associated domain/membrane-associated phospholipid phosphatase
MMEMMLHYGWVGLLLISIAEAAFLPFAAPELILIPLAMSSPKMALPYAALAVGGTLLGALLGYFIGQKAGRPLLRKFMSDEKMEKIRSALDKFGIWAVIIAGLTPLPFKLFTITSGAFRMRRSTLLVGAFIGRTLRFGSMVLLAHKMKGHHMARGMESKFLLGLLLVACVAVLVWYIRSDKGQWVRKRLLGLVHFFRNDFLSPLRKSSRIGALFLLAGVACSIAVAMFGSDVVVEKLELTDTLVWNWIHMTVHPGWSVSATIIDWAFSTPVEIAGFVFVAFMLLFRLRKRAKMRLFAGVVIGMLLIQVLFHYFVHDPVDVTVNKLLAVTGESFPSGKVMAAIILYTSLAYIVWLTQKSWWKRLLGLGISLSLIVVAPLSPVLLGKHSLSSTLGGLVAGILWMLGCLCTRIVFRYVEAETYRRIV